MATHPEDVAPGWETAWTAYALDEVGERADGGVVSSIRCGPVRGGPGEKELLVTEGRAGGSVLVVGTRNVCRSAYLERRLGHMLAKAGVTVASAGTEADAGRTMDRLARGRLEKVGGLGSGFVARELTPELVSSADLVLTVTRATRAAAVQLHRPAVAFCFTFGDFADLMNGVSASDVGAPQSEQPAIRSRTARATPGEWALGSYRGSGAGGTEQSWVAAVAATAAARRGFVPARKREAIDLADVSEARAIDLWLMSRQVEKQLPGVVAALTPPVATWAQRAALGLAGPSR